MPTLDFKGKQFVYAHHLSVPFRQLDIDTKKSVADKGGKPGLDDNLIIHGDNLHALKALLPKYAGKVKCIYIDPPYNTGNEGWCYNDNVNAPLMKEWIKKEGNPVDKEDLERHDKWLCMMWPRLQLLHELLTDEGVIFISIDDNEVSSLKKILDDIFGEDNFVGHIVVQLNPRGRTLDRHIAKTHEYVLAYMKNYNSDGMSQIAKNEDALAEYKNEDKDGKFRLLELRNRNPVFNRENRPNLYYAFYASEKDDSVSLIKTKTHNIEVFPVNSQNEDGCWTWGKTKAEKHISLLVSKKVNTGAWRIYRKDYIPDDGATTKAKALWLESEINNENGKELMRQIFDGKSPFDYPKSPFLIKKCLEIATANDDESIVLDSFAGSGTTAHAVLALNKEDGGNRKFILVECEDYADTITAERVRRVIKGVPMAKDDGLKNGLGGSFTFCELGKEINIDNLLKGGELPDYDELARYAFFTSTGQTLDKVKQGADYFVGETDQYRVHVIYRPDAAFLRSGESALNAALAASISKSRSKKTALVFATHKFMGQKELTEMGVTYCQLPYAIHRVMGD